MRDLAVHDAVRQHGAADPLALGRRLVRGGEHPEPQEREREDEHR
jgi:hypothetical protein